MEQAPVVSPVVGLGEPMNSCFSRAEVVPILGASLKAIRWRLRRSRNRKLF